MIQDILNILDDLKGEKINTYFIFDKLKQKYPELTTQVFDKIWQEMIRANFIVYDDKLIYKISNTYKLQQVGINVIL